MLLFCGQQAAVELASSTWAGSWGNQNILQHVAKLCYFLMGWVRALWACSRNFIVDSGTMLPSWLNAYLSGSAALG